MEDCSDSDSEDAAMPSMGSPNQRQEFATPSTALVARRQEEFTPEEGPEYNPNLPLPPFRITEEDPLHPLALAFQMCTTEHIMMYKSLRGVEVAPQTNTVERHSDMVWIVVEEVDQLRKSNNRRSLIILERDREIERVKAELSKQQGYARANLFVLRKFLRNPGEAHLKLQLFDDQLQSSALEVPTRMATFI